MRSQGAKSTATSVVTATPRQLESLIRLSEALAKMKFAEEVSIEDVKEAARLINVATQRVLLSICHLMCVGCHRSQNRCDQHVQYICRGAHTIKYFCALVY